MGTATSACRRRCGAGGSGCLPGGSCAGGLLGPAQGRLGQSQSPRSGAQAAATDARGGSGSRAPAQGPAAAGDAPSAFLERRQRAWRILRSILAIERKCHGDHGLCKRAVPSHAAGEHDPDGWGGPADAEDDTGISAECLMDEPTRKYFLCGSLDSPNVVAYFWVRFTDVDMEDLVRALVDTEERQLRDAGSEYQVVRQASEDDPTREEDVAYVLRAPWPFSDREVLHRRWQLPLGRDRGAESGAGGDIDVPESGAGLAILMQSIEDEGLLPLREDRVRAVIHKAGYLVCPNAEGAGCDLAVCQQMDLGGLCPAWAHAFLTRYAVNRGIHWAEQLRDHCHYGSPGAAKRVHHPRSKSEAEELSLETASTAAPPPENDAACGQEILDAVLEIERQCLAANNFDREEGEEGNDLTVERVLDEPAAQYFLCSSLDSPTVIAYLRVELADVTPREVWRALVDPGQQLQRDPASEYQVVREAREGDPTLEEDVTYVLRAVWPFWDRDILSRRWSLPLSSKGSGDDSIAVVMRSIDDDDLLPQREDRVRAFVHKCAYLLRPLDRKDTGASLELAVCQQVDMGGLCPEWAQELLTRYAVDRGLAWAEELREHCQNVRQEAAPAREPGGAGRGPAAAAGAL